MRTLSSPAWGNIAATVTSEHNQYNGLDLYDYAKGYCMDGIGHPGLDISLPCGHTLYAIADGVITCAGSYIGSGSDASACNKFENTICSPGTGPGRVQLELNDDDYLIYGHCRETLVPLGSFVTAGQAIARVSGAGTGAHLHIERRVRSSDCTSGWRIINPEALLTGVTPPPPIDPFDLGEVLTVTDSLNLRDEPGTGDIITTMPAGTRAIVITNTGRPLSALISGTRY